MDCPLTGTGYLVSISTPAQTPTSSDPKSIQVTVRNNNFSVPFATLFGQSGWNVGQASVAVVDNAHAYALMTLRPPATGSVSDVKDIAINGGTHVAIHSGDVGSNANMIYDGTCSPGGSVLTLDSGYKMYYYDPFNPPEWCTNNPAANKITALIQDPKYPIPSETSPVPPARTGAVPSSDPACVSAIAAANADPFYQTMVTAAGSSIECLLKGKYDRRPVPGRRLWRLAS